VKSGFPVLVATVLFGCSTPSVVAVNTTEPQVFGPWSVDQRIPADLSGPADQGTGNRQPEGPFEFGYHLYRDHITQIDGARCEHRPTCSRYSIEAIRKHGFLVGALLSLDRLFRGGRSSVIRELPIHKIERGQPFFEDPVEANDFFL
jgi:hypothetical protein